MSRFIELTVYGDATKIVINMDYVIQMWEGSNPDGFPYTRLAYNDVDDENILTCHVREPIKKILGLLAK